MKSTRIDPTPSEIFWESGRPGKDGYSLKNRFNIKLLPQGVGWPCAKSSGTLSLKSLKLQANKTIGSEKGGTERYHHCHHYVDKIANISVPDSRDNHLLFHGNNN